MIETKIIDGSGSSYATTVVYDNPKYDPGLLVYTQPYSEYNYGNRFFENSTYGAAMNINAAATGTPVLIHNGIDTVAWTASALSGTWVFNSTAQAYAGTHSIDATRVKNGNQALFAGTAVNMTNYVSVSGKIRISTWAATGNKAARIQLRSSGTNVGTAVNIGNYVNISTKNVWQAFNINKSDFGVSTQSVNQAVITITDLATGDGPTFYLDDFRIEETGAPVVFSLDSGIDETLYVESVDFIFADNVTSKATLSGSTQTATNQFLSYNKLLGVNALTNGILFRRYRRGKVIGTSTVKQVSDFFEFGHTQINTLFSDDTNTFVNIRRSFDKPWLIEKFRNDYVTATLSDDLSGLLLFKVKANVLIPYDPATF